MDEYKPAEYFKTDSGTPSSEFDETYNRPSGSSTNPEGENYVQKAKAWASNDENVIVESNEFSSKHYSIKTQTTYNNINNIKHDIDNIYNEIKLVEENLPQDGKDGTNGVDGINGTNSTVTLGNVIIANAGSVASVTNSGTLSNAVLNFTLPKPIYYSSVAEEGTINLFDKTNSNQNTRLFTSDGSISAATGQLTTDFIDVNPGDNVYCRGAVVTRFAFYDQNESFIFADTGEPTQAPVGAFKFKAEIRNEDEDTFECTVNSTLLPQNIGLLPSLVTGTELSETINLFNVDDVIGGYILSHNNHNTVAFSSYSTIRNPIKVNAFDKYKINVPSRIWFIDSTTNDFATDDTSTSIFIKSGYDQEEFTIPANTDEIWVSVITEGLSSVTLGRSDRPSVIAPKSPMAVKLKPEYFPGVENRCWYDIDLVIDGDSQFGPVFNSNYDKMPTYIETLTGGKIHTNLSDGGKSVAVRESLPGFSIVESIENWPVLPSSIYLVMASRADALAGQNNVPLGTDIDEENKVTTTYRGALKHISERFYERMNGNGSILVWVGSFPDTDTTLDLEYTGHQSRILKEYGHRFFDTLNSDAWPWVPGKFDPYNVYNNDPGHIGPGLLHYSADFLTRNFFQFHKPVYYTVDKFYR